VLGAVRTDIDGASGSWKLEDGILHLANKTDYAHLRLPINVIPEGSYDLQVKLIGSEPYASGTVKLYLPCGKGATALTVNRYGETYLDMVNGKRAGENGTSSAGVPPRDCQVYLVEARVMLKGDLVEITVMEDGVPALTYKGKQSSLSIDDKELTIPDPRMLGLGAALYGIHDFRSFRLRMLSGTAKIAETQPASQPASRPTSGP
jgi:hypothetical protein